MDEKNKGEISIEQIRRLMVDMLVWFDGFAEQHNLTYFIDSGTLLGAVRHKGFIPWDDDMDLVMLRADYERMIEIFRKEPQERYQLKCFELQREYLYPFAKLSDSHTTLIEDGKNCGVEMGVFIDIVPFDNDKGDTEERVRLNKIIKRYNSILDFKMNTKEHKATGIKGMLAKIADLVIDTRVTYAIQKKYKKLEMRFYEDDSCEYLMAPVFLSYRKYYRKEWFRDTTKLEFEGQYFSAPIDYLEMLYEQYRNYMKLPPADKRNAHHGLHVTLNEKFKADKTM